MLDRRRLRAYATKWPLRGSALRIVLRSLGMVLNAMTYALAARRLSPLDMGIWALATAVTTITLSLDLGLASTLRNRLAERRSDGDARITFEEGFDLCVAVALSYGLLLVVMAGVVALSGMPPSDWWTPIRHTMATALGLCVGLILVRMPFNLATSAFYSYNEPDIPVFWEVFNFFASFVLVAAVLAAHGSATLAATAFLAGGTLTGMACTWQFLRRRGWRLRLRWPRQSGRWLRTSASFGLLQVISLGLSAAPSFVVGSFVRVEEVTLARASMILCQAVLSLHLAHAMPLWTEFTQLRASDDWVTRLAALQRRLWRESILLVAGFVALATVLPLGVAVWLNRSADPRVTTAFCAWGAACGLCNLHSLVLNGAGRPMLTASAVIPGTLLAAALAWVLAPRLGSPGVALGFAVGGVLSASLMAWLAQRVIRAFRESRSQPFTPASS